MCKSWLDRHAPVLWCFKWPRGTHHACASHPENGTHWLSGALGGRAARTGPRDRSGGAETSPGVRSHRWDGVLGARRAATALQAPLNSAVHKIAKTVVFRPFFAFIAQKERPGGETEVTSSDRLVETQLLVAPKFFGPRPVHKPVFGRQLTHQLTEDAADVSLGSPPPGEPNV